MNKKINSLIRKYMRVFGYSRDLAETLVMIDGIRAVEQDLRETVLI